MEVKHHNKHLGIMIFIDFLLIFKPKTAIFDFINLNLTIFQ